MVDFSQSTGKVELFYNPTGVNKYQNPINFSAHFTGNAAVTDQAVAYMLVNSMTDLQQISTNLDGDYALGTDISGLGVTLTQSFGQTGTPFTGRLNGDFKTISGLTMDMDGDYGGLFGLTSADAVIENLRIESAVLTGLSSFTGILVGENHGTVRKVSVSGTASHDSSYAGRVCRSELRSDRSVNRVRQS